MSVCDRVNGRAMTRPHTEKNVENRRILDSLMVEHMAVNRGIVGSSPTRGV